MKALLLALLLEQGTPHCMEAQRCCLNKWQASQRSKAFKHVSFFFSGIISRCNTFGAWRYFDNSKFWFCLFCIYRHILSMVFFFKLCFSFSTSSPINLFAVFQGCHNAGSELCSPAGPCSLAGKTIPAAG